MGSFEAGRQIGAREACADTVSEIARWLRTLGPNGVLSFRSDGETIVVSASIYGSGTVAKSEKAISVAMASASGTPDHAFRHAVRNAIGDVTRRPTKKRKC